jgi:hypothetical protein
LAIGGDMLILALAIAFFAAWILMTKVRYGDGSWQAALSFSLIGMVLYRQPYLKWPVVVMGLLIGIYYFLPEIKSLWKRKEGSEK